MLIGFVHSKVLFPELYHSSLFWSCHRYLASWEKVRLLYHECLKMTAVESEGTPIILWKSMMIELAYWIPFNRWRYLVEKTEGPPWAASTWNHILYLCAKSAMAARSSNDPVDVEHEQPIIQNIFLSSRSANWWKSSNKSVHIRKSASTGTLKMFSFFKPRTDAVRSML